MLITPLLFTPGLIPQVNYRELEPFLVKMFLMSYVSVAMFQHQTNIPNDFDSVKFGVTGRSGSGHYIAYWHWQG